MANFTDNAIARLQDLAEQCTTADIKFAPDYPVENAAVLPACIAHLASGDVTADNASMSRFVQTAYVDFMFPRQNLKKAYQDADAICVEYGRRLCGDPTLNGTIDTIIFPARFIVTPTDWDNTRLILLRYTVQFKELSTPMEST
jgi:hypothetical protein